MDEKRTPDDGDDPLDPLYAQEPVDSHEPVDPREAARVRRRDHDLAAGRRELMRPGMGKVFKQITDAWERDAEQPRPKRSRHRG